MVLTRSFVRAKRPCTDGFRWFVRQFDEGGNYQELLDTMVAAGRVGDACWLLEQFGPTGEVRVVDEIEADALVFAGTLQVRGNVEVEGKLHVGHLADCDQLRAVALRGIQRRLASLDKTPASHQVFGQVADRKSVV